LPSLFASRLFPDVLLLPLVLDRILAPVLDKQNAPVEQLVGAFGHGP
jgi:hypothetical protein